MTIILYTLLISSFFLILYNYVLYPVSVVFLSHRRDFHIENTKLAEELTEFPSVSFIIAAYNEEAVIERKIHNTLALDYPRNKIEIIIISDGSTDSTPEIVKNHASDVVGLFQPQRAGKSAALNRAVEISNGDILVFSDANNDFSQDSIKQLIRHFEDDNIGAVTGAKHIYESKEREASTGDGLYWRYEAIIKKAESRLGSITASEGEILAVRKTLFNPIDPTKVNDDAAITFDIVKAGKRVLYEENAIASELASIDMLDDINVKTRMTFGGFQTIRNEFLFLIPPTHWFAFCFFSHKILRWLVPHFLIIIFVTSLMLWFIPLVSVLLVAQLLFYSIALYGWRNRTTQLPNVIYVPMYFTVMNYALFLGFIRYCKDSTKVQWKKAER